jgi:SUZ domain
MRRNFPDRHRVRSQTSHSGSATGEDADLSDIDPSETGSQGGRSNTTSSSKRLMTIAEREAAYNEARSRIFMDFEEKEKAKEKDMSASSSTFSQISGSASTSAGRDSGSVGDIDDSISTAATESEWSGPATRDKIRRSGSGNNSVGSSSRSPSYNANGGSSRGSRATSPSFSYASLYEPPPATYETSQYIGPPVGYVPSYMYPYPPPPPGQAQGQPMMPPYPYYTPYPYHHSQQQQQPPQHPHSDPTSPTGSLAMFPPQSHPHAQPLPYPPYMWPHGHPPPPPPPQHAQSMPPNLHQSSLTQPTSNAPQTQNGSYPVQFIPPPSQYNAYMTQYYTPHPSGAQGPPTPHFQGQPVYPHPMNGANGTGGLNGVGVESNNQSRRNGSGGGNNPGSRRNAPKVRSAWSYGPGTSIGGYNYGNGDTVGPRLSSVMRRTSGNSSAGSGGNGTPGDEASSTAVRHVSQSHSRSRLTNWITVLLNNVVVFTADVHVYVFQTPSSSSTGLGSGTQGSADVISP